jgi:hypothetical protein
MTRKLSKLEKFGLIGAAITGMLYFYLTNFYDPQQEALKHARERLNRSVTEYNQLQASEPPFQLRKRLESRRDVLAGLEEELKGMNVSFGAEDDLIRSQHWVYRLMERLNLRIISVTPKGRRQELFTWHVYSVRIESDFAGFIAFLQKLRAYTTPLRVDKVTISGDVTAWPLQISMELWI